MKVFKFDSDKRNSDTEETLTETLSGEFLKKWYDLPEHPLQSVDLIFRFKVKWITTNNFGLQALLLKDGHRLYETTRLGVPDSTVPTRH